MTINIGLFDDKSAHVGADFRLLDADLNKVISDQSPKLVIVRQSKFGPNDWTGIITYCGVGRWRERDTSDWLRQWIQATASPRSFSDVTAAIEREGTAWLNDMRRHAKYSGMQTFMLAGIIGGATTIAIISNFDRIHDRPRTDIQPVLSTEIATVSTNRVIVTGMVDALSDENYRALEAAIRRQPGTPEVQRTIALVIKEAAAAGKARASISSSSFTYSVNAQGDEAGYLHGPVPGSFNPIVIQNEIDMSSLLKSLFGANVQIVPTGAASISPQRSRDIEQCHPSLEHTPSVLDYQIVELSNFGILARPHAMNSQGQIVGQCFKQMRGPPEAVIWDTNGDISSIFQSPTHSYANGINDDGLIVGTMAIDGGAMRAFIRSSGQPQILHTLGGANAHGTAINSSGTVVGSSWTIPGNTPGNKRERAFIVSPSGELRDLGAARPDWCSRPTSINDDGVVVGFSMSGEPTFDPTYGFIWTQSKGFEILEALTDRSIAPAAINANGVVVGLSGRDSFIWSSECGLRQIPLPAGSTVRSINNLGDIVYNRDTPRGTRSFVWISGSGEIALPVYRNHQSEACYIDDRRRVLGHMSSGRHSHAIKWLPK